MSLQLLDIDAATYEPHPLHSGERMWSETNCYVDLWIEVLHAFGFDPIACAAFTLSTDFEGDQWTFFKFPLEDLRAMYGIEVGEMNVWAPTENHIVEQLALGRLLTIEADSWYLPDTAGVSYQLDHVKSAIVPQLIDSDARRLGYFHNAGYFELNGDDYDGVLRRTEALQDPRVLPPYVELVKLDAARHDDASQLVDGAIQLTRDHLARRPATNPVPRMRKRLADDLVWLSSQTLDTFHRWAFGFCRQCGANAELAATYVDWLAANDDASIASAADAFRELSNAAKTLQFNLARVVRGRAVDVEPVLDAMERHWDSAMAPLVARYG
ncbi:MAG: hypothetical protein QOI95_2503 [Acidimicrobiaceae bacterium]|jgi:hypothetical protein